MSADTSLWTRALRSTLGHYAIAVAITVIALLVRRLLDPVFGDFTPYTTLYPGIAFLALYVGLGPSLVSVILGLVGAVYWFVPPRGSFEIGATVHVVNALTFLLVCGCIVAAGEISRRSQIRFQRTEKLFETFLDNSPGTEFLKDEEGRYVYVNKTTKTQFTREFIGKTDSELFPGPYAEQWRRNDLKVLQENRTQEFVESSPSAEGEHTWLSVKFPVVDEEGRRLLGGKSIDITEQTRAEEELRGASAQLRGFLESVPTGLTRCSRDLRYIVVNHAYAEMVGLPAEQIAGRPIVDVMGAEAWEKIRPYVERVLRGERVEYEMPLVYASGGPAYIHVIYTPDRDRAGEVVGWLASVTDITENKRVEAQLRKAEKLATAGQLAASLAHEINNPLSSVTNALYLLQSRSDLDAAASSLTDLAAGELARVSRIVKQSLSYYRPGTVPQKLDLGAMVEESLQIFGEKFQRSGIQVTKRLASETSIHGFPDEIRQVIDNLLLNALEAMPKGGRLAVCVHWSRNWKSHKEGVRLTIADTGPGIPKEQMARVFEPFFTTKPEKGTGLGLWVVSGIVAKHEGSIRVRSAEIKGKSGIVVSILWPSGRELQVKPKLVRSESAA